MLFDHRLGFIVGVLAQIGSAMGFSHQSNIPVFVQTKNGQIQGFESIFLNSRVRSFLGVPFAQPPVGKLRFRPPIAKQPWNGTYDATVLAPACAQPRDTYNETFWGSEMWNANTPTSEDCLYMNIWSPAEAPHNLTVMLWVFGGGFYYGSPSLALYDGRALALKGNVIVVNINYRVGPFGYLYMNHPDAPGNVGMIDQQLALHWVRENIEAFGGNPNSISLFGESAGASSIVAHLIAPGSRNLFNNGILQSGSLDNPWSIDTPERALDKAQQLARLVNCNQTEAIASIRELLTFVCFQTTEIIECLRDKPASDLIAQIWNLNLKFLEFPFAIVSRDPNFFREYDAFVALHEKKFRQDVNLMIGINHDEGNFWNIYNLPKYFDVPEQPLLTLDQFNECVQTAFGRLPEMVREAASYVYLGEKCDHVNGKSKFLAEQVNQMTGDNFFTCDSIWLADQMSDGPGKVYIYYFDQPSSANVWPRWTGVMHGYEIEFVFGVPTYNLTAGYTNREKALSHKMMQFWSSFASTGTPVLRINKETEDWPAYHAVNNRRWMHLKGGSHVRSMLAIKERECKVWRTGREIEYHQYLLPLLSKSTSQYALVNWITVFISLVFLRWTVVGGFL